MAGSMSVFRKNAKKFTQTCLDAPDNTPIGHKHQGRGGHLAIEPRTPTEEPRDGTQKSRAQKQATHPSAEQTAACQPKQQKQHLKTKVQTIQNQNSTRTRNANER
jgi:hypothetical protein